MPWSCNERKSKTKGSVPTSDLTFRVVFREDREEGGFVAECLEMRGCVSEGDTREQAEANIKDAIRGRLTVMFEDQAREIAGRRRLAASYVGISSQKQTQSKGERLGVADGVRVGFSDLPEASGPEHRRKFEKLGWVCRPRGRIAERSRPTS